MKHVIVVVLALALAISPALSSSDRRKVGIGVVLGAPTGFTVKYWESQRVAYQGSIGGMFHGGLMIAGDYLVQQNALRNQQVPFYYGAGMFLGDAGFGGPDYSHGKLALGVRAAFGLDYAPREHPIDVAIELGPSLLLTPVVGMGVQLSVSFRFYP
ncbi:MAG: hypothetical protein HW389_2841 [Bacteroidetes bacterium]|nr:hypothetical protein [Bacteroidota bacterium]